MIAAAQVAARVRALPALSSAVARLHALAADPRSSAADFEALLRPDPALSANLLRLANAAHFGLRARVETVRQAVAVLGVRRVVDAATTAAFAPILPAHLPGYDVPAAAFWTHCAAVAVLSERIALEVGHPPEATFTAGLLHDAGKLAIAAFVADAAGPILARARAGAALVRAEHAVLGVDHPEVGALVAEAWSLPPAVTAVARWHHRPTEAPEAHRRLACVVHAADALAHALGFGADAGELARELDPAAAALAGASVRTLERVASEGLESIRQLGELFGGGGKP